MQEMIRASDLPAIRPGAWLSTGKVWWQFLGMADSDDRFHIVFTDGGQRSIHRAQILWHSATEPTAPAPLLSPTAALSRESKRRAQRAQRVHARRKLGHQFLSKNSERTILAIIDRDGPGCHYCGRDLDVARAVSEGHSDRSGPLPAWWPTKDHKIPRSAGGVNQLENYLLACRRCNNRKGDRTYEEFVAELEAQGLGPLVR